MKTSMLDKVFTEPDRRVVRNGRLRCLKPNFKEICKQDLGYELKDEQSRIEIREIAMEGVLCDLIMLQYYPEHYTQGTLEHSLKFYAGRLDCIFHSMHRIAYLEGLLDTDVPELLGDSDD